MGTCMSAQKQQSRRKQVLDAFDQPPADTNTIDPRSLPTLTFHALLTNVKIKRCSYVSKEITIKENALHENQLRRVPRVRAARKIFLE